MPTYIKKVTLKKKGYGIKFSGKSDEFIKQIQENTNEKGYFNFEINERKEVGEYGDTHYMKVDEWKPQSQPSSANDNQTDDIPF